MAVPLLWAAIIFVLYSLPASVIPKDETWELIRLDKIVHFSLFFIWTLVLAAQFKHQTMFQSISKLHHAVAVLLSLFYGGALEYFQEEWFPSRSSDPWDMVANAVGALFGAIFFNRISRKLSQYLP